MRTSLGARHGTFFSFRSRSGHFYVLFPPINSFSPSRPPVFCPIHFFIYFFPFVSSTNYILVTHVFSLFTPPHAVLPVALSRNMTSHHCSPVPRLILGCNATLPFPSPSQASPRPGTQHDAPPSLHSGSGMRRDVAVPPHLVL